MQFRRPWLDSWVGKIHWRWDRLPTLVFLGFPCGSAGKESAHNVRDPSSIPGLGRSPGEGKGYSLKYSGLENSMDYLVHGVTKSWILLREFHFQFPMATPSLPGHAHWSGVWCWVFAVWCVEGQKGCCEWQCDVSQWQGARFDLGPQAAVGSWLSMVTLSCSHSPWAYLLQWRQWMKWGLWRVDTQLDGLTPSGHIEMKVCQGCFDWLLALTQLQKTHLAICVTPRLQ